MKRRMEIDNFGFCLQKECIDFANEKVLIFYRFEQLFDRKSFKKLILLTIMMKPLSFLGFSTAF